MARTDSFPTERAVKGGQARAAALSPEERSESARRAVKARWARTHGVTSVGITVGTPQRPETTTVQIKVQGVPQIEPLVSMEVGSCSLNSHSYVITPKTQGGSFTQ